MFSLAHLSLILGGTLFVLFTVCLVFPSLAREGLRRFPRSKWAGWVLLAIALPWAAMLLADSSMFTSLAERVADPRLVLCVLAPTVFFLIVTFMDELLAPRALGCLLLLAPEPILAATRAHESPLRLVVVVLAYVFVVCGLMLVLSPCRFRMAMAVWIKSDTRCRCWGVMGMAVGLLVILLGLVVY